MTLQQTCHRHLPNKVNFWLQACSCVTNPAFISEFQCLWMCISCLSVPVSRSRPCSLSFCLCFSHTFTPTVHLSLPPAPPLSVFSFLSSRLELKLGAAVGKVCVFGLGPGTNTSTADLQSVYVGREVALILSELRAVKEDVIDKPDNSVWVFLTWPMHIWDNRCMFVRSGLP